MGLLFSKISLFVVFTIQLRFNFLIPYLLSPGWLPLKLGKIEETRQTISSLSKKFRSEHIDRMSSIFFILNISIFLLPDGARNKCSLFICTILFLRVILLNTSYTLLFLILDFIFFGKLRRFSMFEEKIVDFLYSDSDGDNETNQADREMKFVLKQNNERMLQVCISLSIFK